MTYFVFARKYRPKVFDDVIGQAHVIKVLKYAVINNRVPHALLFSGPKGTGKTTVARILAKAVNCESTIDYMPIPCGKCGFCCFDNKQVSPDIFEIDGASNNSVDHIRYLRENISYSPVNSKYKIYIIDEVHMLSKSAFNALLKTLEEPPSHVIFILATTEYHKIPQTIISRCQHHRFTIIEYNIIKKYLTHICKMELINVDISILYEITRASDGSLRDALTMLDKIAFNSDGGASIDMITSTLGIIDEHMVHSFANSVLSRNLLKVFEKIDFLYKNGYDINVFYRRLVAYFKNLLILKKTDFRSNFLLDLDQINKKNILFLANKYDVSVIEQILYMLFKEEIFVKKNDNAKIAFEVICLKINNTYPVLRINSIIKKINFLKKKILCSNLKEQSREQIQVSKNNLKKKHKEIIRENDVSIFLKIQERISKFKPSLSVIFSKSKIVLKNKNLIIIKVFNNKYYYNTLKNNLDLLKNCVNFYYKNGINVKIFNKETKKKKTEYSHISKENRIFNDPIVTEAIKIFDAKVDTISIE